MTGEKELEKLVYRLDWEESKRKSEGNYRLIKKIYGHTEDWRKEYEGEEIVEQNITKKEAEKLLKKLQEESPFGEEFKNERWFGFQKIPLKESYSFKIEKTKEGE